MPNPSRGNASEAAILNAFVERGYTMLLPFGEGHAYDLVVDLHGGGFLRLQCKTAWPGEGCMLFNTKSTDHGQGQASYVGLADMFGVYFPPAASVYLVPVVEVSARQARLRLTPARNNQRRRVRLAEDFRIDRWSLTSLQKVAATAARAGVGARAA